MKPTATLQILQTSDVHGYVYPTSYVDGSPQAMGLAKIQTKIKQIEQPNRLLFETGDCIQGSPLTYYASKQSNLDIHPMALVFNHMNYDYITIGNHEFNYGLDVLHSYLDHLDATIVNANLLHQETKQPFVGVTHDIRTLEHGPKIGIIGVTTHYIPNWEQPSHIEHLVIKDAFDTTKALVASLRPTVDYLIVSYHGGFEKDLTTFEFNTDDTGENQGAKMLLEIPDIDLLLTGHQHRLLTGTVNNTTYVQPGFNAQYLAEINVQFEYDKGWTHTTSTTLHDMIDVKADSAVLSLLASIEQDTQIYLDTPVGTLDQDLRITNQLDARLHKHPLVSLINYIQLLATNADISLCSLGNGVSGFNQKITIRDVIGTYQFPNTLVIKQLTGSVLRRALEKSAEFFDSDGTTIRISDRYNHPKLQLYAYDMYDPINYTIDVSKPVGARISNLTFHGKPIDATQTFNVVMNNYRASGGGDYVFLKDSPIVLDTQQEVIELLINYIVEHKHITIPHTTNIKVRP